MARVRSSLRGLALALSLIATGPSLAAPASNVARLTVVDLTDDFGRAWEATTALPDAEKANALRSAFAETAPGLYGPPGAPDAARDAAILNALRTYPQRRGDIERVSSRFNGIFAPAVDSFEAAFGPMRGYPPIYLVHSLGGFDGAMRSLNGRPHLLFGADMIAVLHKDEDLRPLFHHELFHLYHQARLGPCPQVWCSLWREGLATYVAARLNPGATDATLLLEIPVPLRPAVAANRQLAVCAIVQRLGSTGRADHAPLFGMTRLSPDLPPRFGYVVGYEVAEKLARTRTLEQLASLPQADVRPLIQASLRDMADCGGS